jgi:hypothetical protein
MPEQKLRLDLFCLRKGEEVSAVRAYYTLGRKLAGGPVARVVVPEDMDLRKEDTLVFNFTTDPFV